MSKDLWYAWPRNRLGQLVIRTSEEAETLGRIVSLYPYARRLLERKVTVLDKAIARVNTQGDFKLEFGIKLATEVQLLREVLSACTARTTGRATHYVKPQAD